MERVPQYTHLCMKDALDLKESLQKCNRGSWRCICYCSPKITAQRNIWDLLFFKGPSKSHVRGLKAPPQFKSLGNPDWVIFVKYTYLWNGWFRAMFLQNEMVPIEFKFWDSVIQTNWSTPWGWAPKDLWLAVLSGGGLCSVNY